MTGSVIKGYIGKEDIAVQTNTSAAETFNRTSSTGGTVSITKMPDIWNGTGKIDVAEAEIGDFTLTQTHTSDDGNIAGSINTWIFQDDDMSDDATVTLPQGLGTVFVSVQSMDAGAGGSLNACGIANVRYDTLLAIWVVTIMNTSGTYALVNADTDDKACIFVDGTDVKFKNRIGFEAEVLLTFLYA